MSLDLQGFKQNAVRLSTATIAVCAALGAGINSAAAAEPEEAPSPADVVLTDFRDVLVQRAEVIGSEGVAELEQFDSLDGTQRNELANYFLGVDGSVAPGDAAALTVEGGTTVLTDGDFTWESVEAPNAASGIVARAATSTKSTWATQWFKFAGITISETKVSGTYTVSGGKATKVNSYACTVVQNIDPLASVTSSKNAAYVSGGKATMECKVKVKRGVPTPWGHVSWSTKEAVQYLRATGAGRVEAHGWK